MEISKAYTFDDVLLIPQKSGVQPSTCDTSSIISKNVKLQVPIISAAMDTVSESKLAIAMAQLGGVSCFHYSFFVGVVMGCAQPGWPLLGLVIS